MKKVRHDKLKSKIVENQFGKEISWSKLKIIVASPNTFFCPVMAIMPRITKVAIITMSVDVILRL
ncbi:MAG: hypothetical protein Phog2KO_35610 [Phototrophicaceae bacterium]